MTTSARTGLSGEFLKIVRAQAPSYNEWPSVIRRRKIVVSVVLLIGATLLGYSLSRPPGDSTFCG